MARIESTLCLKLMLRVKTAVNQQTIKTNACPSESVHRSTSASGELNGSSLSYRIGIEFESTKLLKSVVSRQPVRQVKDLLKLLNKLSNKLTLKFVRLTSLQQIYLNY
jgi:hypothetical protein